MITPTQSQIDAALNFLNDLFARSTIRVINLNDVVETIRTLTAAAQVGELPQVQFTRTEAEYNKLKSEAEISIIALQGEISRTIERCKQVVTTWFAIGGIEDSDAAKAINAALDKLKDES